MQTQGLDNNSDLSDRQSASQPPVGYWIGLIVVFSIPFWFGLHLFCGGVEPPRGNKTQLEFLLGGVPAWNEWRAAQPDARIALDGFDLSDGDLRGINLDSAFIGRCDMARADLSGSSLVIANAVFSDMAGANLSGADAREAQFRFADLSNSNLSRCNFTGASLDNANLIGANLNGAEFTGANLIFANLEEVEHWRDIKDIRCANIYGVSAPRGFREWALNRGALEYDRDSYQDWIADCVDTTEAHFPSQLLKLTFRGSQSPVSPSK